MKDWTIIEVILTQKEHAEVKALYKELLTDSNATFKSYNRCLNRLEEIRVKNDVSQVDWNQFILTL